MKNEMVYEWGIEQVTVYYDLYDPDDGMNVEDIDGTWFEDQLSAYPSDDLMSAIEKRRRSVGREEKHRRLVLLWHIGNDVDGELERSYAYVQDGRLPIEFENGRKVPQRYHRELERSR